MSKLSITPEQIWASKEMIIVAFILLIFGSLLFSFKSKNKIHEGIATVMTWKVNPRTKEKIYTLRVRPKAAPRNQYLFETQMAPDGPNSPGLTKHHRGEEIPVFYRKTPQGEWTISHIPL